MCFTGTLMSNRGLVYYGLQAESSGILCRPHYRLHSLLHLQTFLTLTPSLNMNLSIFIRAPFVVLVLVKCRYQSGFAAYMTSIQL